MGFVWKGCMGEHGAVFILGFFMGLYSSSSDCLCEVT
jgi:hypothetical protein